MFSTLLVVAFLVVFGMVLIAASLAWNVTERKRQRVLDKRLQRTLAEMTEADTDLLKKSSTSDVEFYGKLLERFSFTATLQDHLAQANMKWSVGFLVGLMLVSGLLALNILMRVRYVPGYLVPLGVAAVGFLPYWVVLRRRTHRLAQFEEEFPEALDFLARAMRAGHAFSISLELLSQESPEPLATEFRQVTEEHNLGLPLEASLVNLARRVPLLDVRFFVSAVMLQSRTGGNLSEILIKLGYVIRERFKLKGQVRALSAQGRLTGKCLAVMPIIVVLLMMVVNAEYMRGLFDFPYGRHLIGAAVILQCLAFYVIRRIVDIKV